MNAGHVDADRGCPLFMESMYTGKATRIVLANALILAINWSGALAQILEAVVCRHSISMVYLLTRPFSSDVKPREPMRLVRLPIDLYRYVALSGNTSGNAPRFEPARFALNRPAENASFRIVVEYLAQVLRCKIGLSHEAPQMLSGERPEDTPNAFGPRYFSALEAI